MLSYVFVIGMFVDVHFRLFSLVFVQSKVFVSVLQYIMLVVQLFFVGFACSFYAMFLFISYVLSSVIFIQLFIFLFSDV